MNTLSHHLHQAPSMTIESSPCPSTYSLRDYCEIFDLHAEDLDKTILDCQSGFSSFNAEFYQQGHTVISCDDYYAYTLKELIAVAEKYQLNAELFLEDYTLGKEQKRYLAVNWLQLPFAVHQFQLALCSENLLKGKKQDYGYCQETITGLLQVAEEVRIFLPFTQNEKRSENIALLMMQLQQKNFGVELRQINYSPAENKSGNPVGSALLRIWAKECVVVCEL